MAGRPKMKARRSVELYHAARRLWERVEQERNDRFGTSPPMEWRLACRAALWTVDAIEELVKALHKKAKLSWSAEAQPVEQTGTLVESAKQLVLAVRDQFPAQYFDDWNRDEGEIGQHWSDSLAGACSTYECLVNTRPDLPLSLRGLAPRLWTASEPSEAYDEISGLLAEEDEENDDDDSPEP